MSLQEVFINWTEEKKISFITIIQDPNTFILEFLNSHDELTFEEHHNEILNICVHMASPLLEEQASVGNDETNDEKQSEEELEEGPLNIMTDKKNILKYCVQQNYLPTTEQNELLHNVFDTLQELHETVQASCECGNGKIFTYVVIYNVSFVFYIIKVCVFATLLVCF